MKKIFVAFAALLLPSIASAHAVVFPKRSAHGAYEKYVLRVPNEKDVATTRVEIRFPAGLRVVSFSDVAGWQLEEIRDSANAVVGAVWTALAESLISSSCQPATSENDTTRSPAGNLISTRVVATSFSFGTRRTYFS